jgi:hypothetical protein
MKMRRILVLVAAFLLVSCDSAQRAGFLPLEPQYSNQDREPVFLPFDPNLLTYAERADSVLAVKGKDARLELEYQGIELPDEKERVFFELFLTTKAVSSTVDGTELKKGESIWIKARLDEEGGYNVVLEPAGLRFDGPVELTFSFRLRDFDGDGRVDDERYVKEHFRLLSRDDDGADWVALAPLSVSKEKEIVHVKVKIHHFTRFAMATN